MNHLRNVLYLLLITVAPATQAATVTFTDRASWTADLTAAGLTRIVTDDFGGIVDTGDILVVNGFTRNGLTYTPNAGTQLVLADRDAQGYDFGAPASVSFQLGFPSMLTISFDRTVSIFGFGFDVGAFPAGGSTTDLSLTVTTGAGESVVQFNSLGGSTLSFIGLRSDAQLLSVSLTGGLFTDPVITNVSTAAVPEPGSLLLVAVSLLGCALARRRDAHIR